MTDQLLSKICAGSSTVYEILLTDKGSIRLRHAENHSESVTLISSVIPTLIEQLRTAHRETQNRQSSANQ
jgi:hypothetical protein